MDSNKIIIEMIESKQQIRVRQLIIHNILEILELYPQYSAAQHFCYITDQEIFKKDDLEVLKIIEKYKDKLEEEVIEGEEEYFETELFE